MRQATEVVGARDLAVWQRARSSRIVQVSGWVAIIWVVIFWRLGYVSLLDPDEAHYAQLTREMVRAHSWLVPLLNGQPFIDKPVLYHWLQAAAVRLLGESAFALRLPSALAALTLFATVRWTGTQLFGTTIGRRSAVMFATLPLTFVLASVGVFDMLYGAFLFGAVACLLVAGLRSRPGLQYIGWPLLTLAVMTKGPVALLLVTLFGLSLASAKSTRVIVRRLDWAAGIAFVLVAGCPWFVWMWVAYGDRFVRDYLLAGNLWYFTAPRNFSTRNSSAAFYIRTFVGAFFPWSVLILGLGADTLRRRWRDRPVSSEELALWMWTLVVMGFFSVARFKLDYYIFPAAPAACILAAYAWSQASALPAAERSFSPARWTRVSVVVIGVILLVAGALASVALFRINLGLSTSALVLPLALAAGGAGLIVQVVRRGGATPMSMAIPAATLLCVYMSVVVLGLPILEQSRPTAQLGRWIARHAQSDAPVAVYGGVDEWRSSIRYYTDRQVVRVDSPEELEQFMKQWPNTFVLMVRSQYGDLRRRGMDIQSVAGRPAVVGNSGRYLRRQVWGRLVVVSSTQFAQVLALADTDADVDLADTEIP